MNPLPVRETTERGPTDRPQNVPMEVTPFAVQDYDYYRWSFVVALMARYLSVWGTPWWRADPVSAPVSGDFSTDFSTDYDGGVGSPTAPSFSTDFSSDFS